MVYETDDDGEDGEDAWLVMVREVPGKWKCMERKRHAALMEGRNGGKRKGGDR